METSISNPNFTRVAKIKDLCRFYVHFGICHVSGRLRTGKVSSCYLPQLGSRSLKHKPLLAGNTNFKPKFQGSRKNQDFMAF